MSLRLLLLAGAMTATMACSPYPPPCDGARGSELIPIPATPLLDADEPESDYRLLRSEDGETLTETYTRDGQRIRVVYRVTASHYGYR